MNYPLKVLIGTTLGMIAVAFPGYTQTNPETIALCTGNNNTVRITQSDQQLTITAINQKDQITWLNTSAQAENTPTGVNYSNQRGEQTVTLFVPQEQESCRITIGDQPTESGTLTAENMINTSVAGTLTYRERMALPSGATILVKLLDISRQDTQAIEIASQTIVTQGEQVPIPFELTFDPTQIEERNSYAVRGEIYLNDQLAFTTTQVYPVLTQGNGTEVNLILQKVSARSPEDALTGTKWLLEDLTGMGVMDRIQTTIEFGESNRLAGSGGCNRYMSSYELNDGSFKVGLVASTQMMCPEAVMNQESNFFQALEKAYNLRIEGPYLFIDVEGSETPLKFTRLE